MPHSSILLIPNAFIFILLVSAEPFVWIGAVTNTSFTIHMEVPHANDTQILLTDNANLSTTVSLTASNESKSLIDQLGASSIRQYTFTDLNPLTKYHVAIRSPSSATSIASVTTYPPPDSTRDIHFAFSSCQGNPSDDDAFKHIYSHFVSAEASLQPPNFFMIHMGDLHYADISKNDVSLYGIQFRQVASATNVHRVMRSMPMAYMYDDHDYGANNAGFSSPSRKAALQAYRRYVPSYQLPSEDASYHAFSVGRVRVIMTDLRAMARKEANSTLSTEQRLWLFSQFAAAGNFSVLVWMSSKPWIARSRTNGDSWGGYSEERRAVADELVRLNVTNLIMIAGDAHMLAADNGSNSDYSSSGGAGFPVLQAAPLARRGTSKGGPYSQGCFAYRLVLNRQYGLVKLSKLGVKGGPCVQFEGYRGGETEPRILFERCGRLSGVTGSGGNEKSCRLPLYPVWIQVLIGIGVVVFSIISCSAFFALHRKLGKQRRVQNNVCGRCENDEGGNNAANSKEDDKNNATKAM
ncbi:unnamed protein product [Agarophyton chilense]